jgi:hypothetical protein
MLVGPCVPGSGRLVEICGTFAFVVCAGKQLQGRSGLEFSLDVRIGQRASCPGDTSDTNQPAEGEHDQDFLHQNSSLLSLHGLPA